MHEDPTAIINAVLTLILMRNQSWQLKQADCIGQNNDDKTYKWSFLCWQLSLKSLSEPLTLRWPKHTWRSSSSWSPGLEIKGWHRSCQTWSKCGKPGGGDSSFKVGLTHKKVSDCLPSRGTVTKDQEQFVTVRSLSVCEGALLDSSGTKIWGWKQITDGPWTLL